VKVYAAELTLAIEYLHNQ